MENIMTVIKGKAKENKLELVLMALFALYVFFICIGLDVFLSFYNLLGPFKPHIIYTPMLVLALLPYLSRIPKIFKKHLVILVWAFLFGVLLVSQKDAFKNANNEFIRHIFFIIFLVLNIVAMESEKHRKAFLSILEWSYIFVLCMLIYEFFIGLPFSMQTTRSAAFFLNPNGTGESLIFMLIMIFSNKDLDTKKTANLLAMTFIALICTVSRSSILILILLVPYLIFFKIVNGKTFTVRILTYFAIFYAISYDPSTLIDKNSAEKSGFSRKMEGFNHLANSRIKNDFSSQQRIVLAIAGFKSIINEKIILGKGAGYYDPNQQRTHNLFIETWIQFGVFSVLILGGLLYFLIKRADYKTFLIPICIVMFGAFDHNGVFQSKVMIIAIAFCLTTPAPSAIKSWFARAKT